MEDIYRGSSFYFCVCVGWIFLLCEDLNNGIFKFDGCLILWEYVIVV